MNMAQLRDEEYALFPSIIHPKYLAKKTKLTSKEGMQKVVELDRYALRDNELKTLKVGDLVIAELVYDPKYPVQGYGFVKSIDLENKTVVVDVKYPEVLMDKGNNDLTDRLPNFERPLNKIIKPLEVFWEQIAYRTAKGVASVEKTRGLRRYWFKRFFNELKEYNGVPGGRILYGAGSGNNVTLFNCLSGDTLVQTTKGAVPIKELHGEVKVLSKDGVYRTADFDFYGLQELYEVTFSNGEKVRATAGHNWFVDNGEGTLVGTPTTDLVGYKVPTVSKRGTAELRIALDEDELYSWQQGVQLAMVRELATFEPVDPSNPEDHTILSGSFEVGADLFRFKNLFNEDGRFTVTYPSDGGFGVSFALRVDEFEKEIEESTPMLLGYVQTILSLSGEIEEDEFVVRFKYEKDYNSFVSKLPYVNLTTKEIRVTKAENELLETYEVVFHLSDISGADMVSEVSRQAIYDAKDEIDDNIGVRTNFVTVTDVAKTGEITSVYCCKEPETNSFVIGSGILTGNCFVMPAIPDSRRGISRHRETTMEIMSRGGGVGSNGSALRPKDEIVVGVNGKSSGAISWLDDLSKLTSLVQQGGSRRGAQMIALADWHPDLLHFMMCKIQNPHVLNRIALESTDNRIAEVAESFLIRDKGDNPIGVRDSEFMTGANISVLVSDDFMKAVENGDTWDLRFPDIANFTAEQKEYYDNHWSEMVDVRKWEDLGYPTKLYETYNASELWEVINVAARYSAEPGVIFIDTCNNESNCWYYAPLVVTNPCFTGDMRLLTTDGYKTFEELDGTEFDIINHLGNVTRSKVWKSGVKNTVELTFEDEAVIRCTPDHRFMLSNGNECEAQFLLGQEVKVYDGESKSVVSVYATGVSETVYDFHEPETHWGIVEGVIAHNCGEQPLPPYAVCNLFAINLANFYDKQTKRIDYPRLRRTIKTATRFADNVIDHSFYFLEENEKMALSERRVGLGVMGLADLLIKLEVKYGSDDSIVVIDELFAFIRDESYISSAKLAYEKGAFPLFDADKYLESGFTKRLPDHIRLLIREYGIRNVCLLTVAPTGSTGTMVGVSTGLEPYFGFTYFRSGRLGKFIEVHADIAMAYLANNPTKKELPDYFVSANDLKPLEHVRVQATIQKYIDSAISKTCNAPSTFTVEENKELYLEAWKSGCKGVTVYADGARDSQVLSLTNEENTFDGDNLSEELSLSPTDKPLSLESEDGVVLLYDNLTVEFKDTRTCSIRYENGVMVKEC